MTSRLRNTGSKPVRRPEVGDEAFVAVGRREVLLGAFVGRQVEATDRAGEPDLGQTERERLLDRARPPEVDDADLGDVDVDGLAQVPVQVGPPTIEVVLDGAELWTVQRR